MSKFHYCSSADELYWYIDLGDTSSISFSADKLHTYRNEIRKWIEEFCTDNVYVWNGVTTPKEGSTNWGSKLAPQGDAAFFFSNEKDYAYFCLKWS